MWRQVRDQEGGTAGERQEAAEEEGHGKGTDSGERNGGGRGEGRETRGERQRA